MKVIGGKNLFFVDQLKGAPFKCKTVKRVSKWAKCNWSVKGVPKCNWSVKGSPFHKLVRD